MTAAPPFRYWAMERLPAIAGPVSLHQAEKALASHNETVAHAASFRRDGRVITAALIPKATAEALLAFFAALCD